MACPAWGLACRSAWWPTRTSLQDPGRSTRNESCHLGREAPQPGMWSQASLDAAYSFPNRRGSELRHYRVGLRLGDVSLYEKGARGGQPQKFHYNSDSPLHHLNSIGLLSQPPWITCLTRETPLLTQERD